MEFDKMLNQQHICEEFDINNFIKNHDLIRMSNGDNLWVFSSRLLEYHRTGPYSSHWEIEMKIKDGLHDFIHDGIANRLYEFLVQFWVPKIGGRRILTTSNQPFGLNAIDGGLCKYRKHCASYEINMEGESEEELGLIGRVFKHKIVASTPKQYFSTKQYPQREIAVNCGIHGSVAVPIFEPSGPGCVGVLELVHTDPKRLDNDIRSEAFFILEAIKSSYRSSTQVTGSSFSLEDAVERLCGPRPVVSRDRLAKRKAEKEDALAAKKARVAPETQSPIMETNLLPATPVRTTVVPEKQAPPEVVILGGREELAEGTPENVSIRRPLKGNQSKGKGKVVFSDPPTLGQLKAHPKSIWARSENSVELFNSFEDEHDCDYLETFTPEMLVNDFQYKILQAGLAGQQLYHQLSSLREANAVSQHLLDSQEKNHLAERARWLVEQETSRNQLVTALANSQTLALARSVSLQAEKNKNGLLEAEVEKLNSTLKDSSAASRENIISAYQGTDEFQDIICEEFERGYEEMKARLISRHPELREEIESMNPEDEEGAEISQRFRAEKEAAAADVTEQAEE